MAEICIVIPVRNYGQYIEQCINSVIRQSDAPTWHLVIVNDGSTDGTSDVLARYRDDSRITVINLAGKGLAAAGNAGISACHAPWILRLDADDWLEPGSLRALYAHAQASHSDFVYGDLRLVDQRGRNVGILSQDPIWTGSTLERSPVGSGALYRREVWEILGGYDESLRYQEDFDFWLKVAERFQPSYLALSVYVYRQHYGSMSTNRSSRAEARAIVKQRALSRRHIQHDTNVAIIVSCIPPISTRIDPRVCVQRFQGSTLLDVLYERLEGVSFPKTIAITCAEPEVERWAAARHIPIVSGVSSFLPGNDFIDSIDIQLQVDKHLTLFVSPYYPLLAEYRFREMVDTLLLGDYRYIHSVVADSSPILVPNGGSWTPLQGVSQATFLPGAMRAAGGLVAVRTGTTTGPHGCIEIMWPEDFMVRDVSSLWSAARILQDSQTETKSCATRSYNPG